MSREQANAVLIFDETLDRISLARDERGAKTGARKNGKVIK